MPVAQTSLLMSRPFTTPSKSLSIYKHQKPSHAPQPNSQNKSQERTCKLKPLAIKVDDELHGNVSGFLHIPQHYRHTKATAREKTAAILLSGSSGGVLGPSSIYPSIADKLASLPNGILVLRLDYRYPGMNKYCVADVQAAMKYLETRYAISRFVLVGWSFGGAPVFTLGGSDKRVVACAAVASQTAGTNGIGRMAPKPVLLMHGTGDRRLGSSCSRRLFELYGRRGERELKLFEGDGHSLRKNAGGGWEDVVCFCVEVCWGGEEEGCAEEVGER